MIVDESSSRVSRFTNRPTNQPKRKNRLTQFAYNKCNSIRAFWWNCCKNKCLLMHTAFSCYANTECELINIIKYNIFSINFSVVEFETNSNCFGWTLCWIDSVFDTMDNCSWKCKSALWSNKLLITMHQRVKSISHRKLSINSSNFSASWKYRKYFNAIFFNNVQTLNVQL